MRGIGCWEERDRGRGEGEVAIIVGNIKRKQSRKKKILLCLWPIYLKLFTVN